MLEVKFYRQAEDHLLKFAVILAMAGEKMVLVRHRERDTYEIPGGHREAGESRLPETLTYPEIQPKLVDRVMKEKEAHVL